MPLTNHPKFNAAFDVLQHPLGITSDDWVTRTRTLCINRESPTVEQVFKLTSVDEYGEGMDETMVGVSASTARELQLGLVDG